MTRERWKQIEELYNAVRERGPAALADAEPEVRRKVEAMLEQDAADEGPLDRPAAELLEDSGVMNLAAGARLGHYQIEKSIGKGGMGEVWKAHDSRLGRSVAIKVSAHQFTNRFEREARAIAALNHPNICTLYDVGPNYLVMELVDGATLAERIQTGPIPLEEALAIARQIADGLEAAHEKGIVHRDLKPANIKIRPDASVKVLDFGLAKAGTGDAPLTSDSPTILSIPGMIMGTAAYMSPEQARGKNADKRADIWAFGVVLYEMLTGKRLFHGEDVNHTLAAVIMKEPDLTGIPERVMLLLKRCLEKDPDRRLRDIGDAWALVGSAPPAIPAAAVPLQSRSAKTSWIVAVAILALIASTLGFVHFRETQRAVYPVRFQIPLPDKGDFGNNFTSKLVLSPDGRKLAVNTAGPGGGVWVRDMDSLELRLLPGTENALSPFWSPDSRFLAFGVGNLLRKVSVGGGPPQTLCESTVQVGSGSWSREGIIIFGGTIPNVIHSVPEAGGAITDVTALDPSRLEANHLQPTFLPDGRHFVYFRSSRAPGKEGIFVGSLDVKPAEQSREPLVATEFGGVWAPSATGAGGHLFFMRDGALVAQLFDTGRLKLIGEPVPVVGQVATSNNNGFFSVSATGSLAYRTGESAAADRQLAWFDRQGQQSGTAFEPAPYLEVSLSPDGTRAAIPYLATSLLPDGTRVAVHLGPGLATDVWLHDFTRGVSTRFTFDQSALESTSVGKGPVWSPDGNRIAFRSRRGASADLFEKSSNGAASEALLVHSDFDKSPDAWSRDGRFLLYSENNPKTSWDLMVLPLEGNARKPVPLLNSAFSEEQGSFSPDMRWFAYASNESGRFEVYIQPFNAPGSGAAATPGKLQISRNGGMRPKWRADGKEIIFRAPNGTPMAVDIATSPAIQAGIPKALFTLQANAGAASPWDVTADGKRFLVSMPLEAERKTSTPITVVLNWEAGLKN